MPIEHTQIIENLKIRFWKISWREINLKMLLIKNPKFPHRLNQYEVPNLSRLVKQDLLKRVNEYSLGADHQDLLESTNSVSMERAIIPLQNQKLNVRKKDYF